MPPREPQGAGRFTFRGHRVVCFSTADWDTLLPTNKHQLMTRLARRGARVLFVETLGTRAPRLASGTDIARIGRRLARGSGGPVKRAPRLYSLSPMVRPSWAHRWEISLNKAAFRSQARKALRAFRGAICWVYSPYAVHLLDLFEPAAVVYHVVDDLAAVPGANRQALREAEMLLYTRADLVVATERSLYDRARPIADRTLYAPNVADYRHFAHPKPLEASTRLARLRALPRPRLLFSGNLAPHKVDFPLLAALARDLPDASLALVGPLWEGAPADPNWQDLLRLPNVHWLDHVPYDDLPAFLHEADVLLIPYVLNDATSAVFPLKFFEYLATGRPVVSAPLPSLLPYKGLVSIASSREQWLAEITASLAAAHRMEPQRRALARRNTWERRIAEFEQELGTILVDR